MSSRQLFVNNSPAGTYGSRTQSPGDVSWFWKSVLNSVIIECQTYRISYQRVSSCPQGWQTYQSTMWDRRSGLYVYFHFDSGINQSRLTVIIEHWKDIPTWAHEENWFENDNNTICPSTLLVCAEQIRYIMPLYNQCIVVHMKHSSSPPLPL